MLVLSRKEGQQTFLHVPGLATPIVVTVTKLERGRVQLGFDAPQEVRIVRDDAKPHHATRPPIIREPVQLAAKSYRRVIINGKPHDVDQPELSYADVIRLAAVPMGASVVCRRQNESVHLSQFACVPVTDGMTFSAAVMGHA